MMISGKCLVTRFLGWGETLLAFVPARMMDNDQCGTIGGMIGRGNEVLGVNLPHCRFVHHKSHMT
jgi:hypothetical protein